MEYLGLFSAFLFVLSALPVAWSALKGNEGPPMATTLLIVFGALGMLIYEISSESRVPALLNYGFTFSCWTIDLGCKMIRRAS